ncbi:MAG: DUF2188 domain-containing protein [Lactococcus lactis]|nr:DUF2188 domain-containing protein [Lactococcus lactis]MDN6195234.1 DUF2188 domain-containing protein [Atopostipes suicloacalis]MDN6731044.1 DUF2188 domain-containing protein [Atopostipes suicloacalis]
MPYTKSDYPDSMKGLDKNVRIKAIDILNAMLEEGYDEDSAIPISIDQAKDWIEDAGEEEIEKLSDKDLTKHEESSDSSRLQDADVRVTYHKKEEQWAVKSVGAKEVDSYHDTKKEAVERGKEITENRDSQLIKEKKDH